MIIRSVPLEHFDDLDSVDSVISVRKRTWPQLEGQLREKRNPTPAIWSRYLIAGVFRQVWRGHLHKAVFSVFRHVPIQIIQPQARDVLAKLRCG